MKSKKEKIDENIEKRTGKKKNMLEITLLFYYK
jgi:hypothetical protein